MPWINFVKEVCDFIPYSDGIAATTHTLKVLPCQLYYEYPKAKGRQAVDLL